MTNVWKDKKFWQLWAVHALIACVLGWFAFGPILHLTVVNAGWQPTVSGIWLYVFIVLIGIWATQMLALWIRPQMGLRARWLMLLGAYIQIGPPIAIAFTVADKMKVSGKAARAVVIIVSSIIIWWLLRELLTLYAMTVSVIALPTLI